MHDGGEDGGLHVVVVAYGPPDALRHSLLALGGNYPVTVVDNGSDPEVRATVRELGARYDDPGANLGFAAGVNRALDALPASADVLLLNPDAAISSAEVSRLRRALHAKPDLACAAPALQPPGGGAPAPAGWAWHSPARAWAEALGLARWPPQRSFLSGAVLLLRAEARAEVGPFDERFFLYAEEEDWQRRALDAGWRIRYCADITAVHAPGGTDRDLARQQLRLHAATERYVRKWYGAGGWMLYRSAVIVGQLLRAVVRRGWRRRSALRLARLYLIGPDRSALAGGAVPTAPDRRALPRAAPHR